MNYRDKVYKPEFLEKSQWFTEEQLRELQLEGLQELLTHAREHTQYYKNLPQISSLDDINELPILTKSLIHNNFNEILVASIPHCITTTGGTVSAVTVGGDLRLVPNLGENRFESWYGHPRAREVVLWGSMEAGQKAQISGNRLWLPVEGIKTRDDAYRYLGLIRGYNATYMRGYSLPLAILAHYALEDNAPKVYGKVGVIVSHCETLLPQSRKEIEDAFGCHVYNFYGSRDLGSQAQDCSVHKDLHVFAERYILEVVDGRFLFTDLLNYAFPMIRYENQDVGEFSGPCPCGRGLPTIKPLIGRVLHYLKTKKDAWVTAFIFYLPILYYDQKFGTKLFKWVESYQFKQREEGKVTVLLKTWATENAPTNLEPLTKVFREYIPSDEFDIDIEVVDTIPKSKSGKQIAVDTTLKREW